MYHYDVRTGGSAAVVITIATGVAGIRPAHAEPDFEASGFVGFGWFSDRTELGNSWAPEQVPNTAPVVGGRLGWLAIPALVERGAFRLQLAVEGELSIATAFTGGTTFEGEGARMSYFAPVFGWRAHASLRLAGSRFVRPHLVVGGGGETIASSSPFMSKETDPVVYWGPGASVPVSDRWLVRLDLRHGIMAARDTGTTWTVELQLGVATTFGPPVKRTPGPRTPEPDPDPIATDDSDLDGDGIPDRMDLCPTERETINGIDDGDGCSEPDPDGDGIIATADTCPDAAEDFDRFSDEDGCPDPDNEHDGIEDAHDVCPLEPETRNGIDDDDGCPDTVPAEVTSALGRAASMKFEGARARVTNAARTSMQPLLGILATRPDVRITITGRPDKAGGDELAKRRAEALKWYLVDQGITEDRITTKVGPAGKPVVELALTPR